jgi:hypothetical protein
MQMGWRSSLPEAFIIGSFVPRSLWWNIGTARFAEELRVAAG